MTASCEGANLSSLGPGPRPCDLVGLRHLSKGSISKHRLIGLGLQRVDLGDGSVRNTCPFPRHPSLEPSVPQAPRQPLHASPRARGSGGGAGDRAHPHSSGPRPLAGQARPHDPLRWWPDPGERRVPGQHAGLGAQPRGGPGTEGPTVAAGPLPWSAVREGRPRGPLHSPRPDADSSAWSRARGWSSWSPLAGQGVGAPAPPSPSTEPQPGPSLGTPGDLAGGFQGRLSTPPTPTPRRSQRHPWHRERPRRPQAQDTPQAEGQLSPGEDGQGWAPGPEPLTQGRERGAHRVLRGPSVAVSRCL